VLDALRQRNPIISSIMFLRVRSLRIDPFLHPTGNHFMLLGALLGGYQHVALLGRYAQHAHITSTSDAVVFQML
jgi:hypothetical protein